MLRPLATPASWLYRIGVGLRNARYDKPANVHRIERPVISIGNITVGGTGKTPTTALIATWLKDAGHHPAIAMRGYKAEPGRLSDEEAEYGRRIPWAKVAADAHRQAAIVKLLGEFREVDCILLDDGFQHRQLHRDLDLVLLDSQARTFTDRLLPAGRLREPLKNLRRASAVVMTHATNVDNDLVDEVMRLHGKPPIAWTRHTWSGLEVHSRLGTRQEAPTWLAKKRMVTLLGIGKPQSVLDLLAAHGGRRAVDVPARDHQLFTPREFEIIARRCKGYDGLLMTEKDYARLNTLINHAEFPVPVVIPKLRLEFLHGEDALRALVLGTVGGFQGASAS